MSMPRALIHMHDCFLYAFMQHRDTQAVGVWFTSCAKVSVTSLPLVSQNFPLLLVRRLHRTSEYLDPVSISLKTSIMQTGLIRSALITISNDGNNMKLCVFVLPALPCRRRCWRAVCTEFTVPFRVCNVRSRRVSGRCDGDEGLTWQVLCW